jgi:hypothetical protein
MRPWDCVDWTPPLPFAFVFGLRRHSKAASSRRTVQGVFAPCNLHVDVL